MKRLHVISLLVALSLSTASFAQGNHLKFKGIPIDGSLSQFSINMKAKGFSFIESSDNVALFKGPFAGSSCRVFVVSADNIVWKVAAEFPSHDNWMDVRREYDNLKVSLSEKYSVEPIVEEELPDPNDEYNSFSSMMKLHTAFEYEKAIWESDFKVDNGVIILYVQHDFQSVSKLQVVIEYYDEINTNKRDNAAIDDL